MTSTFWPAFVASALAALATSAGIFTIRRFGDRTGLLGALLALSAGALIYVGATHLLPQAEHEGKGRGFLALAAGVLVAVAVVLSR